MSQKLILVFSFIVTVSSKCVASDLPSFRILAPQLICPKDDNSPIEKPDYTVITIQARYDSDFSLDWVVRWQPLLAPTQRFTLMVWRTVRALEAKLNGPQPEPFIYVIKDDELLHGVNYIFNVTAKSLTGEASKPKTFYINNTFGDTTLEAVDGRTDMMSVVLVGGQNTYADITYVLEAEVTICVSMRDYHFIWTVQNENMEETLNISATGFRLEVPPHSLQPGLMYDITCYIIKDATGETVTQIELPLEVGYRGLEVYLNVDRLIVAIHNSFILESTVINHDYFALPLTFEWWCSINGTGCDFFDCTNESNYLLAMALPTTGQYEITVIVSVLHQSAKARATIIAIDSFLPVIQVEPTPRVLNKGTTLSLVGNVSNIMPTCTLTWYFATHDELTVIAIDGTTKEIEHGTPISNTVTVYSFEENFLSEITDYTNETEWRQVTAETKASAGRARILVECNCSHPFDCGTENVVLADIYVKLNEGPIPHGVTIFPASGTALETVFRISSRVATDPDGPLRYTFHCSIGHNNTLVLGSYLEHMAVEAFLPYVEGGTEVWVEICDVLEACTNTEPTVVDLLRGEGRSMDILMADILAHIKRCELIQLQRVAISVVVTYSNAGQTEPLAIFTAFLAGYLPTMPLECISQTKYLDFLNNLTAIGLDIS